MQNSLSTALLLAAGLGERMRPLTDDCPKPLVMAGCKALIDYPYERLAAVGVQHFIINAYYKAEQVQSHFSGRVNCRVLVEQERLETGGAVVNAVRSGAVVEDAIWIANGDSLWWYDDGDTLQVMAEMWDSKNMDGLLMVCPVGRSFGYHGSGDFSMDTDGKLQRSKNSDFVFCGVQILKTELFADLQPRTFSLNEIYDKIIGDGVIATGRLFGVVHHGDWWHVGTPQDLQGCEKYLANKK